jgi:hypothetical protein
MTKVYLFVLLIEESRCDKVLVGFRVWCFFSILHLQKVFFIE